MTPHQGLAHVLAHIAFEQRARPGAYDAGREVLAHRYRVFQRWRVPRSTVSRFWVEWVLEGTFKHEGHSSTQDEVDMFMKSITQLTSHNHHYGQAIYKPIPRPDQFGTVELAFQQPASATRYLGHAVYCTASPPATPPRRIFSPPMCVSTHTGSLARAHKKQANVHVSRHEHRNSSMPGAPRDHSLVAIAFSRGRSRALLAAISTASRTSAHRVAIMAHCRLRGR